MGGRWYPGRQSNGIFHLLYLSAALPYQQRHLPMTFIGLTILVSGLLSAVAQVIGGILADRFGHRKMFIIYQLGEFITFGLIALLIVSMPQSGR